MPKHRALFPVDVLVHHTWIVGVGDEAPCRQLFREEAPKEKCCFECTVQCFFQLDIQYGLSVLQPYVPPVEFWIDPHEELSHLTFQAHVH